MTFLRQQFSNQLSLLPVPRNKLITLLEFAASVGLAKETIDMKIVVTQRGDKKLLDEPRASPQCWLV